MRLQLPMLVLGRQVVIGVLPLAHGIRAVLPDHPFYRLSFCDSCLNIARNEGA